MTLLERIHSPSLQQLGPKNLYDIITVDENTAILLQVTYRDTPGDVTYYELYFLDLWQILMYMKALSY